ncbi:hypothetical protein N9955_00800 [bacterium]|nr:hypothetical protein [bacterium]
MSRKFITASKARVTLNRVQLEKDIFVKGARSVAKELRPIIERRIDEAQEEMLKAFESHPVTMEIKAGPRSSNLSGLLGGQGNLFSFIGFDVGSNPTDPISQELRKKIRFTIQRRSNNGKYSVKMLIPSKEELESVAPIPWLSGRSWIDGIEKGLAGLGSYLYSSSGIPNSRSGTGIQSGKTVRSGVSLKGSKYVSAILNDFKKRLSKLS